MIKKLVFILIIVFSGASRVLELSDRFLDIHKEGQWLVMMYAPWCVHCKKLEPIWGHVAQYLFRMPIRVGKIDCTRFKNVEHFFKIKEYPTIIFLKGEDKFNYNGDKTRDDIAIFAERLSGPPVQEVSKVESIELIQKDKSLHFLYIGEKTGPLWESYYNNAVAFQQHAFFYQCHPNIVAGKIQFKKTPTVIVYKENTHYEFKKYNIANYTILNETLYNWINAERFPTFPKMTQGNIDQLFLTKKNLVLAIVEENILEEVPSEMVDFRNMIESIIKRKRRKYHDHFQFGWVASPELINTIAMMNVPLPSFIVINTTTHHHHIPEDEPELLTPQAVELFLEQIRNGTVPRFGGKSFLVSIYRQWFKIKTTLAQMWKGNPVLTLLVFGLPSGFLLLICWQGICCPDFTEADDEEDEEDHMKKD